MLLRRSLLSLLLLLGVLAGAAPAHACDGYWSCEVYDGYTACYWYGG